MKKKCEQCGADDRRVALSFDVGKMLCDPCEEVAYKEFLRYLEERERRVASMDQFRDQLAD